MKALTDIAVSIAVYAFLVACVAFGAATILILATRMWGGSCIG